MEPIKPYQAKFDYSYTLGAFPTYELLNTRPEAVRCVFADPGYTDMNKLEKLCGKAGVKLFKDEKTIRRLSDKENVYVIGVFNKYDTVLDNTKSHIMLVNPGNMGNTGTIIRTAAAFGITDLAIITPGTDHFNPKTVRSSMGSVFHMNIECFEDYADYEKRFITGRGRIPYAFMLTAEKQLTVSNCPKPELYTLIFGNEATGLPEDYKEKAEPIFIPQSDMVDSLNITIAAGIGMYMFNSERI